MARMLIEGCKSDTMKTLRKSYRKYRLDRNRYALHVAPSRRDYNLYKLSLNNAAFVKHNYDTKRMTYYIQCGLTNMMKLVQRKRKKKFIVVDFYTDIDVT